MKKLSLFSSTIVWLIIIYLLLKLAFPYISMWIANKEHPLPIPSSAMVMYITLALIGVFVYITTDDKKLKEFSLPIITLLKSEEKNILRTILLIALPFLIGWIIYSRTVPKIETPTLLRIQHPTIPGTYEKLKNPFRNADPKTQEKYIEEGRILYQINCRPCHGTKANGAGPMAKGFRLKPANFTDPGTIATVIESYTLWRIKEGAFGLPSEASPWDSAMPSWKDELTDEQIWKIIMAEYDTAGVEPRLPEKHE